MAERKYEKYILTDLKTPVTTQVNIPAENRQCDRTKPTP